MPAVEVTDVSGAVRAYITAYPGLTGAGNPLAGGFHPGKAHLPATGAVAEYEVTTPRDLSDISDLARIQTRVRASGKAAYALSEYAARRLAAAALALTGDPAVVTTRRGEIVRLLVAGDPSGPTLIGEPGGEVVWGFDFTVRCQSLDGAYGAGVYGAGTYGG